MGMCVVVSDEASVGDMIMIDFLCDVSVMVSASEEGLMIQACSRRQNHMKERVNRRCFTLSSDPYQTS